MTDYQNTRISFAMILLWVIAFTFLAVCFMGHVIGNSGVERWFA